ncbi:DNA polymerase III subunit gamma/tau, partial [Mycobacterium sp. ITM-2017-0098]
LFGAVEGVIDAGHDPRRFATDLLERFRDLIVLQAVPDAVARGVVDGPEDILDRMRDQASRLGMATLTRYAEVVHAGLGEMRGATAPRLLLEVVCARLLLPSASDTEAALLQRVERIETRLDLSIPASDDIAGGAGPAPRKQFVRRSEAPAESTPEPAPQPESVAQPEPVLQQESAPQPAVPEPQPQAAPAPVAAPAPIAAPAPVAAPESEPEPEPEHEPDPEPEPRVVDSESVSPPPSPPPPVRPPAAPAVEAPPQTPAAAVAAGEPNAAAVRSMWTTVREKVRERSRTTEVMLAGAIVRAVEGDTLILSHESAPLAKRLVEQRNADVIREALKDALGVDWKIRCETGGEPLAAPAAPAAPAPQRPAPPRPAPQRPR